MLKKSGVSLLCTLIIVINELFSSANGLTARAQADLITKLPGLNFQTNYKQYSGYLKASPTKNFHYWLTESQGNPAKDPLIVWFNGGPGCSSLEGLLTELGPFHVNKDGATLWENVYAWNKIGNVLYLESPTGVGFSYSNPHNDVTGDIQTAIDNYNALNDLFINLFPEYQGRDFYITGESYAGVYIPTLTANIVDGMNNGSFQGSLKGIGIGNGLLSDKNQINSVIDLLYFRGIIGDDLWHDIYAACCEGTCESVCNFYSHLKGDHFLNDKHKPVHTLCRNLTLELSYHLVWYTQNDPYNTYQDCYEPVGAKQGRLEAELRRNYRTLFSALGNTNANNEMNVNHDSTDANNGFSCWGDGAMTKYLNRKDVWAALHIAPQLAQNSSFLWQGCNTWLNENGYTQTVYETFPYLSHIYKNSNVRMLIYNGDTDIVCNFLGDEHEMTNFTKTWDIQTTKPRYPWFFQNQIGGYVQSYQRIDVATVKGAGHFVPTDRPGPALQMMANFIHNTGDYSKPSGYSAKPAPMIPTNNKSRKFVIPV